MVAINSDPKAPEAVAATCVAAGAADDPDDLPGAAHCLEHLYFGRSKLAQEHESWLAFTRKEGGDANAFTSNDCTCFWGSMRPEALLQDDDSGLAACWARVTEPLFSTSAPSPDIEASLDAELGAIDDEHYGRMADDRLRQLALSTFLSDRSCTWHKFSLGCRESLIGSFRDGAEPLVELASRLEEHRQSLYRPSNAVMVVIGRGMHSFIQPCRVADGLTTNVALPESSNMLLEHVVRTFTRSPLHESAIPRQAAKDSPTEDTKVVCAEQTNVRLLAPQMFPQELNAGVSSSFATTVRRQTGSTLNFCFPVCWSATPRM